MLKKVDGEITIDDDFGDLEIEQASGLKILANGSGGLRVKKIESSFEIGS